MHSAEGMTQFVPAHNLQEQVGTWPSFTSMEGPVPEVCMTFYCVFVSMPKKKEASWVI